MATKRRTPNDLGTTRLWPKNACLLLMFYLNARRWRLNRDLAARYAIYGLEQMRNHSSGSYPHPRPDKQIKLRLAKWPTNNRIVATPERLLALLNNTWHTTYTLAHLDNQTKEVVHTAWVRRYLATNDHDTPIQDYTTLLQAHANFVKVTRLPTDINLWLLHQGRYTTEWANIDRGRQLFISGLGKFDVAKAAKAANQRIAYRGATWNPAMAANDVTASGYGLRRVDVVQTRHNTCTRDHIVRYWDWYCTGDNRYLIDETLSACRELALKAGMEYNMGPYSVTPDTITNDRPTFVLDGAPVDHHPTTLINAARTFAPLLDDWRYTSVATLLPPLADDYPWVRAAMPKPVVVPKTPYTLVPLDTLALVRDAGTQLHNCAGSYARDVQNATCLLFAVKKADKYVGLAELDSDGSIGQAVGQCNAKMPKGMRKAITHHNVQPWNRDAMAKLADK